MLLDGLDEVVDAAQRRHIAAWVDQQIRTYARCGFVLTARPQGYRNAPLTQAHILEVMPFQPQQVAQFIYSWYLATKLAAYGKDDPGVRQDAEREARDMLQRLEQQPQLKELTVNPLLLTMIANVHNYRGVLPENRVKLYAEICDVLLEHWQQAKRTPEAVSADQKLTAEKKRMVLQPLAEEMMLNKTREIAASEAFDVMTPHLKEVGVAAEDIPKFLEDVQASSGLLLEKEAGTWGFAHLTFQEYLCAAHWDKTGKASEWGSAEWQLLIEDSWWHETLRLYAAQTDATVLLQACLQLKTPVSLKLANDMGEEALKLDESLRKAITTTYEETAIIRLRSEPATVSEEDAQKVFGLDGNWRPLEYIQNQFEDRGEVVFDHATGLTWQKSGAEDKIHAEALAYIAELNAQKFAGHDDWRLPTIPELMSLLEPEQKNGALYIDPIFDATQRWCWSADRRSAGGSRGSAWLVSFHYGDVDWYALDPNTSVRAVCS